MTALDSILYDSDLKGIFTSFCIEEAKFELVLIRHRLECLESAQQGHEEPTPDPRLAVDPVIDEE